MSRRGLLLGGLAGTGGLVAACSGAPTASPTTTTSSRGPRRTSSIVDGVTLPVAAWLIAENRRPGTLDWILSGYPPAHGLEGFTSATSAPSGGSVDIMVNTTDTTYRIEAYRMGYYGGHGGRLIASSPTLRGVQQPAAVIDAAHGTVECHWAPSWTAKLTGWPPGFYMFKLISAKNWQQWIPFCVRDDSSRAAFVLMSAVTTYQAYNPWGGFNLYQDESGSRAKRAVVVSFDRPYDQSTLQGGSDFFGNEFPVLYDMERLGLDMTYWTDIDLQLRGAELATHKALISLGHDEYWSSQMRGAASAALSRGTNLAFLGANAIYRKIRLEPSGFGPARLEVNYKDDTDPAGIANPALATSNWGSPPVNKPESLLTGSTYVSIDANDDLVVADPEGWFWKGCGVHEGEHLSTVVVGEYNRYIPGAPGPADVQLFGHSPISKQSSFSDITYHSRPGGGGVLSTGAAAWVNKLSNSSVIPYQMVPDPIAGVTPILLRAMLNLYGLFGAGPADSLMPAQPNWQNYYG